MGIDLDAMRKKLSNLNSGNSGNVKYLKLAEGEEKDIRVVPTSDEDPFKEFFFHYNLGKEAGFLCPKRNFGEDCPVCEFVHALFKSGKDEDKAVAKRLSARTRYFTPVVVRGEEDEGVQLWGYGKLAYADLLELVLNPDYGDISNPEASNVPGEGGLDLTLKKSTAPGASFPRTSIRARRKSTPLMKDKDKAQALIDSVPDFATIFARKTSSEVQEMLDRVYLSEEDAESVSSETSKFGGNAVDKAFQELNG